MDGSGLASVAIISLSRTGGEYTILREEGLVPWHALLEEVGLLRFLLSPKTLLVKESVEFSFSLCRDVVVQELIPVRDVLL